MNAPTIHERIVTPTEAREQFPNAMLARPNHEVVDDAEKNGNKVLVAFFDAAWGRTAVVIKEVQP